jgi:hypothetical protein
MSRGYTDSRLLQTLGDIIFSHQFHIKEVEVECATCHITAEKSKNSDDRLLPDMDICADCHDIEDDDLCGSCHNNSDEPEGISIAPREILFNHQRHTSMGVDCVYCHDRVAGSQKTESGRLPPMKLCFGCHDGLKVNNECELCHGDNIMLTDIHPRDWRSTHGDEALVDKDYCMQCHRHERDCQNCHQGDNLTGNIHQLNYMFNHGLEAGSEIVDCTTCHDNRNFCVACHEGENRIPLLHSSPGWLANHGQAAKNDIENCASCHETDIVTCALAGCHADFDGIRGTDTRIHGDALSRFESEVEWHDGYNYFCFECHTDTSVKGQGFCGYCHM